MFCLGGCSLSLMGQPHHRQKEFEGAYWVFFVLQHNFIILLAHQAKSDECTDSKVPVDTLGLTKTQISTRTHAALQVWLVSGRHRKTCLSTHTFKHKLKAHTTGKQSVSTHDCAFRN